MDCACVAVSPDHDNDTHWGCRQIIRAAKDHTCYECGALISKGSTYFYHTVFGEGSANNYKYCAGCQSVIKQFFPDGWYFGAVWDHLTDYLYYAWKEDLPSSCICKLDPSARDKVCDILDEIHSVTDKRTGTLHP